jgi:hypothetical protein
MTYHLRYSLFPRTARKFRQMVLLLGIISFASFIGTNYSFSSDGSDNNRECENPEYFGTMLVPPDYRLGEFRIALDVPAYDDTESVQQHLAFSTILASLFGSELKEQTNDLCNAVITPSRFPDLHVFLFVNRAPGATEANRSLCLRALQNVLLTSRPSKRVVEKIASSRAEWMLQRLSNPGGLWNAVDAILANALTHIYKVDSIMYALASVGPERFQTIDAGGFLDWLQNQRLARRVGLSSIQTNCRSETDPHTGGTGSSKLPYSTINPPEAIKIFIARNRFTLRSALRYLVIVGNDLGPNRPLLTPATKKFCNQEHAFAIDRGAVPELLTTVRIRCLAETFYGIGSWVAFFCESEEDIPESAALHIMTTIANDPDVLALARSNSENKQARGPYVINVQVTGE